MEQFINKYSQQISFSLSCYDRLVITGNLPEISYAQGMTSYLNRKGIRIFDYAHFAEGHREKIRQQIDSIVKETGVEVHYLKKRAKSFFLVLRKIFGDTKEEEITISCSVVSGDESLQFTQ